MESEGLILWNAVAICGMSKISWQTTKHCVKDDLKIHYKGSNIFFWNSKRVCHLISIRDESRRHQFGQKSIVRIFFKDMKSSRGKIGKGKHFEYGSARIGKKKTHQKFILKNRRNRNVGVTKRIHLPSSRRHNKIIKKRLWNSRITPRQDSIVKSENLSKELQDDTAESHSTVSQDDAEARLVFWSDSRWLIVIMDLEFNSNSRRKNRSLFHWNTLFGQDLFEILCFQTSCKKYVSMTTVIPK